MSNVLQSGGAPVSATSGADSAATATAQVESDALRSALRECDGLAQEVGDAIAAVCSAAMARLAPDPHALCEVAALLALVRERAQFLAASVDSIASAHYCSAADQRETSQVEAVQRQIWARWHSLRGVNVPARGVQQ